ncbi:MULTISPECIES: DUF488 domain-containing protein [Streptomycetaceae]|uniref:DUF488 family protein n=1 Tax=Streptantibioticus cattleyicolor (strain ATCC 35852 / DSM 46488 / JCM 4925 / NBRC 14057 / NRRL 8057) TaxID=1003195 RepID=F8K3T2_STREN|nr:MULTISPECIES: DUF488 family protein [Streptomycetaceae]AEW97621.1 hypothetical protein SCATT_52500 [Streptantibioticus cattleyicolor NRRL 8057 = DSM 46488]MYS62050.1 DUF488 family protein [Streptomyces sp. SID5468]CCB77943.1 conserved protein of unknown function [Streptantibioticus cattleyicolor NRRL 8057 = DSM 46488]
MATRKPQVRVGRIYDDPQPGDGTRVLVDRVWPRGVAKDRAALDEWAKDAAPSTGLRKWYGHDSERYEEFRRRYRAELSDDAHREAVHHLRDLARHGPLTLLTATRDVDRSQAPVLAEVVRDGH